MRFRRTHLSLPAVVVIFSLLGWGQSLREQADRAGVLIGTAVNSAYLSEPAYTATLAREFNMVEPEDAMKWKALRPNKKTFDFTQADRIVSFAQANGMKVRGHTLVWATSNPKWLEDNIYTRTQLHDMLRDHIREVVGHYRGQVFAWDVLNEAFEEHGKLRSSLWYDRPGIGVGRGAAYIAQAFRWAHAADPDALLFYNEADAEDINKKSNAIYSMVRKFKQQGVPIDGIGLQMHIDHPNPNISSIADNIARFTRLGLQVHITEMDVALAVDAGGRVTDPSDLRRQALIYREITSVCLRNPGCTALQTWGFTDKYSWIGWFTHKTKGAALPFDAQYRPKPAYNAISRALAQRLAGETTNSDPNPNTHDSDDPAP